VPAATAMTISDYGACKWPPSVPGAGAHGSRELAEWADGLNEEPNTARAAAWRELWESLGCSSSSSSSSKQQPKGPDSRSGKESSGMNGSSMNGTANGHGHHSSSTSSRQFDVITLSHFLPHQVGCLALIAAASVSACVPSSFLHTPSHPPLKHPTSSSTGAATRKAFPDLPPTGELTRLQQQRSGMHRPCSCYSERCMRMLHAPHAPTCTHMHPLNYQAKAVGSDPLAARLQRLRPHCHLFGHSHFAWDQQLDGTRYVQAPLCYPAERQRRGKSTRVSTGVGAWQQKQEGPAAVIQAAAPGVEVAEGLPVLLYVAQFSSVDDSTSWSFEWAPSLEGAWSEYYLTGNERQPWVTEMAPWVAPRFERRRQRMERDGAGGGAEGREGRGGSPGVMQTEEVD